MSTYDASILDGRPIDTWLTDAPLDASIVDAPVDAVMIDAIDVITEVTQQAYLKAESPDTGDGFGHAVALSGDGTTLAVGVWEEDSDGVGVSGDPTNDTRSNSGAIYIFRRTGTTWSQQAYLKASNPDAEDNFGNRVVLSDDGNTLAASAHLEDSVATGVGGAQSSNGATNSGAVYVFQRSGTTWAQAAYLKASNTEVDDFFGNGAMALSADGDTLAIAATGEDSAATGIDGEQTSNAADHAGAVYIFERSAGVWGQQAYVKASNTAAGDDFGSGLALSDDGDTLAVGAYSEDSAATNIGGNQGNNAASNSGAVYVFRRNATTWAQEAYIKASNTGSGDGFGGSVALSGDGAVLVVGALFEGSDAIGVGGDGANNAATGSGAAYVFTRSGTTWGHDAYVKASNTGPGDQFGARVTVSADGSRFAVAAVVEQSAATGIGGDQYDNSSDRAGAIYVFERTGATWDQGAYVKASNTGTGDLFGYDIALARDGHTFVVGAPGEASSLVGVPSDDAAPNAGAAYVFVIP